MKSILSRSHFSLLMMMAFLFCFRRFAQTGTTSLRGSVIDKSGGRGRGGRGQTAATGIWAWSAARLQTTTGAYEFLSLKPGTYELSVEAPGSTSTTRRRCAVAGEHPHDAERNAAGRLEQMKPSKCRRKSVTLNTTDASIGVAFGENQVKELPLESRNVGDLLSLQAGVVYTGNNPSIETNTDTDQRAVNGARSDQSNVTLDGIPVNPKGGYAFQSVLPVTLDSVEEFRVTTSNSDADEGSAGGRRWPW